MSARSRNGGKARRLSAAAALALACAATPAFAAGPLGPNGSRIKTSDYNIDLSAGPVLADSRTTALAGAYVAVAEGVDGNTENPAAPAVRAAYSTTWFDFDLGLGIYLPSTVEGNDFFNTGERIQIVDQSLENFLFLMPALTLQFGEWGVGYTLQIQSFKLQEVEGPDAISFNALFFISHLELARLFLNQEFSFGFGLRGVQMAVDQANAVPGIDNRVFNSSGISPEMGILWQPKWLSLRLGAAFHFGMETRTEPGKLAVSDNGDIIIGVPGTPDVIYLPRRIDVPWLAAFGAAFQLGARPFNVYWHDPDTISARLRHDVASRREAREAEIQLLRAENSPELPAYLAEAERNQAADDRRLARFEKEVQRRLRERYVAMSRRYLLVTTQFNWMGVTDNSIGIESFLSQIVNRSGQTISFSPRFGMETEIVPHWVKIRGGFYAEPSRFDSNYARAHYTAGMTIKVLPWSLFGLYRKDTWWRLRFAVDIAPRYLGWGVAVAPWH